MLRLMIVDDEYIVRKGLRKTIDWKSAGVAVVGEADSVAMAVHAAEDERPDIVICDIRLPGEEGFSAIDQIRRIVPWAQFIMITAHSDQQYMMKAIHKEVTDYLFKPARTEDILSAVERARKKIAQYHAEASQNAGWRSFISENIGALQENFARELLSGNLNEEQIRQYQNALHMDLHGPYYQLMLMRTGDSGCYEAAQMISGRFSEAHPFAARISDGRTGELAVILNLKTQDAMLQLGDLQEPVHAKTVLSSVYDDLLQLAEAYAETRRQLADDAEEGLLSVHALALKEMLFDAVKYRDSPDEIQRRFRAFTEELDGLPVDPQIRQSQICSVFDTVCALAGIPLSGRGTMCADLDRQFSELLSLLKHDRRYSSEDVSGRALYLVRKRYREDLSLEAVAAELFISSSYLSRILKEKTGHGFGHWVNYYRIEDAKRSLTDTDKGVEEIAEACGYNSYRIFSENFRKYTGMTASEFREKARS